MAVATSPEADRLATALAKRWGQGPFTARELAGEIVAADAPTDLIAAFDAALCRAAEAGETDELDDTLWGLPPTDEDLAQARRVARRAQLEALTAVLTDALTRGQAGELLGISPQAVSKRLASGALMALARGRELRFPAWQFHEGRALPGLTETIAAYPGTPLALSVWATSANPDLDGLTPARALLRRDGVQRVLNLIESISADAW